MPKKRKKKGSGVDSLKKQQMAANYGFALAFMKSDKELWNLFNTAVKKTWDPNMFVAKLRATKWFKKHSADVRNAIMQQAADPATYKANLAKMRANVENVWGQTYGLPAPGKNLIGRWAEMAFRMGWSEEQLVEKMGRSVNYAKLLRTNTARGTAGEVLAQLDELAAQYGLNPGDNWRRGNLKAIVEGDATIQGIQDYVRERAKMRYGAFAEQIDAGRTMMEIADPYFEVVSNLLERNPADIDIHEGLIQKALTMKDEKGRPAAMNINDFSNLVRKDSRWQYTANAKKDVANVTSNLLQSFGLMS